MLVAEMLIVRSLSRHKNPGPESVNLFEVYCIHDTMVSAILVIRIPAR
jgi:hypothetical protein